MHNSEDQRELIASGGAGIIVACEATRALLTLVEGADIPNVLANFLCNLIGQIEDDDWRSAMNAASAPCNGENCECHIRKSRLFELLDSEREIYKEGIAKIRQRMGA